MQAKLRIIRTVENGTGGITRTELELHADLPESARLSDVARLLYGAELSINAQPGVAQANQLGGLRAHAELMETPTKLHDQHDALSAGEYLIQLSPREEEKLQRMAEAQEIEPSTLLVDLASRSLRGSIQAHNPSPGETVDPVFFGDLPDGSLFRLAPPPHGVVYQKLSAATYHEAGSRRIRSASSKMGVFPYPQQDVDATRTGKAEDATGDEHEPR